MIIQRQRRAPSRTLCSSFLPLIYVFAVTCSRLALASEETGDNSLIDAGSSPAPTPPVTNGRDLPPRFNTNRTPNPTLRLTSSPPTITVTANPTDFPGTGIPTLNPTLIPSPIPTPIPTRTKKASSRDSGGSRDFVLPNDNGGSISSDIGGRASSLDNAINVQPKRVGPFQVNYLSTILTTSAIAVPFDDDAILAWANATSHFVMEAYKAEESKVKGLIVTTQVLAQTPEYFAGPKVVSDIKEQDEENENKDVQGEDSDNFSLRRRGRRVLQSDSNPAPSQIELQYTQILSYITSELSPEKIVSDPFDIFRKRRNYISFLKASEDPSFAQLEFASVVRIIPPPKLSTDVNVYEGLLDNLYVLIAIGAAGGSLALAILCGGAYCAKQKNKSRKDGSKEEKMNKPSLEAEGKELAAVGTNVTESSSPSPTQSDARVESYIYAQPDDENDISTLGDPLGFMSPGPAQIALQQDEKTVGQSTINDAFDYANHYGLTGETSNRTTSDPRISYSHSFSGELDHDAIFSDEDSFDQQFDSVRVGKAASRIEVNCPPGRLGVIIDTIESGVAGVNAVKPGSVLENQIRVGDVLVSVDEIDTSGMSAMQVSRMIGQRSQNPNRVLVFVRNEQIS